MKYPRNFEEYKHLINPIYLENFSTVEGKPITNIFNIDPENNLIEVEYDGKREWIRPASDFWNIEQNNSIPTMRETRHLDDPLIGGELKNNQYRTQPTNEEANNFADTWVE
jgi:hypothetical protein